MPRIPRSGTNRSSKAIGHDYLVKLLAQKIKDTIDSAELQASQV